MIITLEFTPAQIGSIATYLNAIDRFRNSIAAINSHAPCNEADVVTNMLARIVCQAAIKAGFTTPAIREVFDRDYTAFRNSAKPPSRRGCPVIRSPFAPRVIESVISAACDCFAVTPFDLVSRVRTEPVAWARMSSIYILNAWGGASKADIGRRFNRKIHSVIYAVKAVATRLRLDPSFARTFTPFNQHCQAVIKSAEVRQLPCS